MPELFNRRLGRGDLAARTGRLQQVAGVRLLELADGTERGVRVLEFRTGSGLVFEVLVERAFDVGRCEVDGMPVAWQSPTGFAGPWYAEHDAFGFHRTFGGGLLATCGLEHALGPAEDTAEQYAFPPQRAMFYGQHGRLSSTPARLCGYGERWDGDECVLWAEGETRQAMVFGETLTLRRRIEAQVGGSCLRIHDEVVNDGYAPTPHMLLYHVNYGWPLVDEGARLLLPAEPTGASDGSGGPPVEVPGYRRLDPPADGFVGQVFEHAMRADPAGRVTAAIANDTLGLAAYETYRADTLPHHLVWRMLGKGTYVVGVEPSTNRLAGRLDARERGELIHLQPGETRTYELELGVVLGEAGITRLAELIEATGRQGAATHGST